MNLDDILKLVEAAKETDFDSFEIEEGSFYFRMERNKPVQQVVAPMQMSAPAEIPVAAGVSAAQSAPVAEPAADEGEQQDDAPKKIPGTKDITSPVVGVYHELPEDSAVKIGDELKEGDVVCIVEAMKLMNEITMPEDGKIVWVALEEGSTVEYEQVLFSYK